MQPMVNMALRAARAAAEIIVHAYHDLEKLKVMTKDRNDFVTEVDRASEALIISSLRKATRTTVSSVRKVATPKAKVKARITYGLSILWTVPLTSSVVFPSSLFLLPVNIAAALSMLLSLNHLGMKPSAPAVVRAQP